VKFDNLELRKRISAQILSLSRVRFALFFKSGMDSLVYMYYSTRTTKLLGN